MCTKPRSPNFFPKSLAATDSATGVNNSAVVVGQNLTDTVTASSTATAAATTVEGIATANALSIQDVGVLDSTLNVGGNGTLTVNETGVVTGSATTVNAVNGTAVVAGGVVGDRLVDPATGALIGYVISATHYSLTPGGASAGTIAGTEKIVASSAYAGFTGNTGGIIDSATGGAIANDVPTIQPAIIPKPSFCASSAIMSASVSPPVLSNFMLTAS